MATAEMIDLDRLLAPISESEPCGADLRWDTAVDEIRKARQQVDRTAFEGEPAVEPDWHLVVDRSTELLATRSKDLRLAGYLTEALLHLHGFGGVRDGFRVLNGLLEKFWDGVYPLPDESDWEPRIAPLVWLTEPDRGARLGNLLYELPLVPNTNGDVDVFSYDYRYPRAPKAAASEDPEVNLRRQEEAARKCQRFDEAVAATSRDFFGGVLTEIQECRAEVARFDQTLDRLLGRDAPGTSNIREGLEKCEDLVRRILRDKGGVPDTVDEDTAAPTAAVESGNGAVVSAVGPLKSREDAFRKLEEVAAFLRRTEPQSPVPYLIERAVAWGRMPFDRLLHELIKDEPSRGHVVELLGIKENPQ